MIDFSNIFIFHKAEGLVVGIFIVLFTVCYYIFGSLFSKNKKIALLISLIISFSAVYKIYIERFYGYEGVLYFVLILVIIGVFFKIIREFFKKSKFIITGKN